MGHPFLFDRYFRNSTALMVSLHTTTLLRQPPKNRVSEVRYSNRKRCDMCFARRDTIWEIRGLLMSTLTSGDFKSYTF